MKKLIATSLLCLGIGISAAATAEVVVVAGAKSTVSAMSKDEVSQVFLGKSSAQTPVDLQESNPVRAEFYKKAAGKDLPQVKSIWSKLIFTGKATMPKEMNSSADVKKAVTTDPNTIGYIEKSAVDGSVKVILDLQ
jgi:ABC-type phosphate transport system substrate-binding protein